MVLVRQRQVFALRHGESDANRRGVYAGRRLQPSPPLTELGHQQARNAAGVLNGLGGIAVIHASSLLRAQQTAEDVADELGLAKDEVMYDPRIEEYDAGSKTGVENSYFRRYPNWLAETPDAEPRAAFVGRVASYMSEIVDEEAIAAEGNLLIVTHAGVCRAIEMISQGRDPEGLYSKDIPSYANARPTSVDVSLVAQNLDQYLMSHDQMAA